MLKKETSGVTSLIVAQRIGTIMDADKIIVLDEGKIVGQGTHKELLRDCAVYKEIAMSQLDSMAAESIHLATETGSHKATFRSAANAGDEFALLASGRHCLRNGSPTPKWGFFQYAAAYDSKYKVELQQGTLARLYLSSGRCRKENRSHEQLSERQALHGVGLHAECPDVRGI